MPKVGRIKISPVGPNQRMKIWVDRDLVWIKISPVGPNQRMKIWVDRDLVKHGRISQWSEKFTEKHGTKIDRLNASVVEFQPKAKWAHMLKVRHADYFMRIHSVVGSTGYFNGSI